MTRAFHKLDCPWLKSAARRAGMIASAAIFATAVAAPAAFADGDPASDVLIGQNAFLPWDAGASPAQAARLTAILNATARAGYPVRVAVIASQSDLGSVTALWRHPQLYARFLDQELSLAYRGPVLIVMPNGVGLASVAHLSPAERAAVAAVATGPVDRPHLATVAQSAAEQIAATAGHPLPPGAASSPATHSVGPSSTGAISYLVLALGAVLIALAWAASLRARPLGGRRAPG